MHLAFSPDQAVMDFKAARTKAERDAKWEVIQGKNIVFSDKLLQIIVEHDTIHGCVGRIGRKAKRILDFRAEERKKYAGSAARVVAQAS